MAAPKITPAKFNEAVTALRIGADIAGAAHLISVSKATLDRYMEKRPETHDLLALPIEDAVAACKLPPRN
jgi:hypothetical protein